MYKAKRGGCPLLCRVPQNQLCSVSGSQNEAHKSAQNNEAFIKMVIDGACIKWCCKLGGKKKWTICLWMAYAMNIWPQTRNRSAWVLEKDYRVQRCPGINPQRFRYLWTLWVIARHLVAHHTTYLLGDSMPVTSSSLSVLHHTPSTIGDLMEATGTVTAPHVSDYSERLRF